MKYKVAICRPCTTGVIRQEVANFCSRAWKDRFNDPWLTKHVSELIEIPIHRFPTDICRNVLVQTAQHHEVDFLFMVDEDASPPSDFFTAALKFLAEQPAPAIIGCPYLSGDGQIQVFQFIPEHSSDPGQHHWKLTRVTREDGFQREGVERVASIGTHTICYDMRVFEKIQKPYFRYSYNPDHTQLLETEEMYCHRQAVNQGVKIYCDWDMWSGHWKPQEILPLHPIPAQDIPDFWLEQAKNHLRFSKEGQREMTAEAQG